MGGGDDGAADRFADRFGGTLDRITDRLGGDFGRLSRIADERGPGEWRSVPIPVYNGADIEQIRLHLKRPDEEEEDREKGRQGTRFVVDVTLSRIGRLQLDGLVYDKEKHMDLIVRTDKRLPAKIVTGIRDIFQEAGETTGLKGGIGFQAAPPNFVEIGRAAVYATTDTQASSVSHIEDGLYFNFTHPPMKTLLYSLWAVAFGFNAFMIFLPIVFGLLSIVFIYLIGKHLYSE